MSDSKDEPPQSPDVHFEPLVTLAPVEVKTNEENETILFCERARLYRFDKASDPPEWKERGTGEVKILRNNESHKKRIVMRRDKTLKICCNHFVTPDMKLMPNVGSDKAWVWTTPADFADEVSKPENLAIRFKDATIACRFKDVFEVAESEEDESQDVTDKLEGLSVGEAKENDTCDNDNNAKDTSNNEAANESGVSEAANESDVKEAANESSNKEATNETGSDEAPNNNQPEAEGKTSVGDQGNEESSTKEEGSSTEATVTTEKLV